MNSIITQTLKELDEELLTQLEEMSALMFTKKEIAVFLEMESDDLKEIIESLDAQARKRLQ